MNEEILYDDLIHGLTQDEHLFFGDNEAAIKRLISIMTQKTNGVITLDLQRGQIVAANITYREYFAG